MALPKQESFTTGVDAAISTYDANWTTRAGAVTVLEATDNARIGGSKTIVYWSGDSFNAGQYAQAKLVVPETADYPGVLVRASAGASSGHGYYFFAGTNDSYFGTADDGTFSDIGADRGAFAANDVIRLEITDANVWTIKKNGATIDTGSDSTFASGAAGIAGWVYGGENRFDDWEGGNLGGAGSSYTVACADGIVFDDTGRKIAIFKVSAADGLALGDGDIGPASFLAAGADSIALNDLASILRFFLRDAADGVAFAEAADRAATFSRSASDGVAFGESAGSLAAFLASASDGIALGDESFYTIVGAIEAFASDSLALSDSAHGTASYQVTAGDVVALGDGAACSFLVQCVAADGVALGDAIQVQVSLVAHAADSLALGDAASSLAAFLAAAADGIALQDLSITIGILATGEVTVTFTTKKGTVTLTAKKPSIQFAVKKPNIEFS